MDFEVKYQVGSEIKTVVVAAEHEKAAREAFASSHKDIWSGDIISVLNFSGAYRKDDLNTAYRKDYGAASFVGSVISFVGWVICLLGLVGMLSGFAGMGMDARELGIHPVVIKAFSGLVVMFSVLYAVLGLVFAALGQHFRAAVDTANHSGEMLALMKSRAG